MDALFPQLQLDRALSFIDLETTSLRLSDARIIDIAVLQLRPNDRPQQFNVRLNPGVTIPLDASEVHGIRDHHVQGKPPFARVAPYLAGLLRDTDLAGYNLTGFDLPVLSREFQRVGRTFTLSGRAVLDVFHLFKRQEPRDLAAAVKFYIGREHKLAHRAAADVLATAQVLNAQLARYPELPARPADLHHLLVDVDIGRKFARGADGRVVMAFGKHVGVALSEVATCDPGYLRWLLGTDLLEDARTLVERALDGLAPEPTGGAE